MIIGIGYKEGLLIVTGYRICVGAVGDREVVIWVINVWLWRLQKVVYVIESDRLMRFICG